MRVFNRKNFIQKKIKYLFSSSSSFAISIAYFFFVPILYSHQWWCRSIFSLVFPYFSFPLEIYLLLFWTVFSRPLDLCPHSILSSISAPSHCVSCPSVSFQLYLVIPSFFPFPTSSSFLQWGVEFLRCKSL